MAGAPLHDPCAPASLLRPNLVRGRHVDVEVETGSDLTRGGAVADWWRVARRAPNTGFIRDLDADSFFALRTEPLARL